jgi:hypothetical protein
VWRLNNDNVLRFRIRVACITWAGEETFAAEDMFRVIPEHSEKALCLHVIQSLVSRVLEGSCTTLLAESTFDHAKKNDTDMR